MNYGGKDADECSVRPLQVCDACDICNLCNMQFEGDVLRRGCKPRSKSPIKMRPPWVGVVELPQMELDPACLPPETSRSQLEPTHSDYSCLNTGRSSRPPSPASSKGSSSRRGNSRENNSRCSRPHSSPPPPPRSPPCKDRRSPPPTPCRACTPTHDRSIPPPQFARPEKLDCCCEPPPSVGSSRDSFTTRRPTRNRACQKPSMPPSPMRSPPRSPRCQQSAASPSSPKTSNVASPPPCCNRMDTQKC